MWSWNTPKTNNSNNNNLNNKKYFSSSVDKLPKQEFNVREHYQHLKENHPCYKELYKVKQTAIKTSYL